jgi:hypothetical protein
MNPAVFDTPEGLERGDLKEIFELTKEALIISFSDDLALSYTSSMMFFYHATLVRPQFKLQDTWIELTYAEEIGDITHQEFLELAHDLSNPLEFEFIDPETGETEHFTEEYAISISNRMATDATFKQQMQDTWIIAAEARYDAVMEQLNEFTS